MMLARFAGVVAFAALAVGQVAAADICNCPREQQARKHGTLSQVRRDVPLPPPLPPEKAVMPVAGGKAGGG